MITGLSDIPSAAAFGIGVLVKGIVLLLLVRSAVYLLRDRSASIRHAVWVLAFGGLLLLPVAQLFVPAVSMVPESARPMVERVDRIVRGKGHIGTSSTGDLRDADRQPKAERGTETVGSESRTTGSAPDAGAAPAEATSGTWSWSTWFFLAWFAGCSVLSLRLLMGLANLLRIRRGASEIMASKWRHELRQLKEAAGIDRRIDLVTHPDVDMPMTWGIWRTVILLPAGACRWRSKRRRVVLMHEMAHIARRDYLTHLVVQAATIIHWMNPLVWYGANHCLTEREQASDDFVLAVGIRPSLYARQLLDVVEDVPPSSASPVAPAMARPSKIRGRIEAICRDAQDRQLLTVRHVCATAAVVGIATLFLGASTLDPTPDRWAASFTDSSAAIVLEGRLVGADGQPMRRSNVVVSSGPGADRNLNVSQNVGTDGSFRLRVGGPGHYMLLMMGPHHRVGEVPVYVREGVDRISMTVSLPALRFRRPPEASRVIGDFNGFDVRSAVAMKRQDDGIYTATVPAQADTLAYQIVGAAGHRMGRHTRSGAGTHHDRLVFNADGPFWDTRGDYVSVIDDVGDSVNVRLDPAKLPESGDSLTVKMSDPVAHEMARVLGKMQRLERRAGWYNAEHARASGESSEPRSYDWSPHRREYRDQIDEEESLPVRRYLILHYFNNMHAPETDSVLARRAIDNVPPTDPVWSYLGWYSYSLSNVLVYLTRTSNRPDRLRSYTRRMYENHPDPDVRAQALYQAIGEARYNGDQARFRHLYDRMMDEFGDRRVAENIRKRYAPNRAIQVGQEVPDFSATSVHDSTRVYTAGGLRGQIYLVDFWYVGLPATSKVERLTKAYEKYTDRGLEIVSVFIENDRSEVQEYLNDLPSMSWPQVLSGTGNSALDETFEVTGVPHFVLVDKEGQIIATNAELSRTKFDSTLTAVFEDR